MLKPELKKTISLIFSGVLVLLFSFSCNHSKVEIVTVKGSDTEVNLVQELAEQFMEKDPDISLTITGGGSGFGIASLINQKTDIANSSRPLNEKEKTLIEKEGLKVYPVIFAQDALAIVVHPKTGIEELSLGQLGKIFRGEIRNWKEIGGADIPVSLYGRQSNSGTFVYFREKILQGEYDPSIKQMNGTAQIIEAVKQDKGGVGYVGIGYLLSQKEEVNKNLTAVRLTENGKDSFSPLDQKAIINGDYPIIRPLFQFVNGNPTHKTLGFIRYELSREGQEIVVKNGYFEINEKQRRENSALGIGLQ